MGNVSRLFLNDLFSESLSDLLTAVVQFFVPQRLDSTRDAPLEILSPFATTIR